MNSKIKLIFFDMEGTLFKKTFHDSQGNTSPSAWTLIAKHLGEKAFEEEEKTKEKWSKGEYNGYVEWMEDTIEIHKKYGLKKDFFEEIMQSIEFHEGVKESFKELNKKGLRTALISGGFKSQADRAVKDLKINHAFAACEYYWNEDGSIAHWNLLPCDYEGKLDFMNLIMKEHGLNASECAFVGDGRNDIPFAKAVGLSIAFNAAKELQEVSTYSINQEKGKENFKEILKYLK
ncbi:MAG TPA: HAD-IB family phosphatase [archaeon]|nr:HAD-IB family phosphatase [archaeon]